MEEKVLLKAVLCFLVRDNEVLLPLKSGKIGKGCRNGYGGGVEAGETRRQAAAREVYEESGGVIVYPDDLEKVAVMHFYNVKSDGQGFLCQVHVYLARKWSGEPTQTGEMTDPKWFAIDDLPFGEMMPADIRWLPIALSGKMIVGSAKYGPQQKELLTEVSVAETRFLPE